jgi:hypothetical protein
MQGLIRAAHSLSRLRHLVQDESNDGGCHNPTE